MMPLMGNTWRLGLALCLLAAPAIAQAAEPRSAEVLLEYQKTLSPIMPRFAKAHGKYLGSGSGTVAGAINGKVVWDLYEDQDAAQLHRTQFVGRITAGDGSSIDFETAGYFVPRSGTPSLWDLTSAVYFFSAQGPAFQSLQGALGVWEGDVDTRTYSHHYRLRVLEPSDRS
jgi:hypothetical protein